MIKAMIKGIEVDKDVNNIQATQKIKSKKIEAGILNIKSAILKAENSVSQKLGKPINNTKAIKKKPVPGMKGAKSHSHDLMAKEISKEIQ